MREGSLVCARCWYEFEQHLGAEATCLDGSGQTYLPLVDRQAYVDRIPKWQLDLDDLELERGEG